MTKRWAVVALTALMSIAGDVAWSDAAVCENDHKAIYRSGNSTFEISSHGGVNICGPKISCLNYVWPIRDCSDSEYYCIDIYWIKFLTIKGEHNGSIVRYDGAHFNPYCIDRGGSDDCVTYQVYYSVVKENGDDVVRGYYIYDIELGVVEFSNIMIDDVGRSYARQVYNLDRGNGVLGRGWREAKDECEG